MASTIQRPEASTLDGIEVAVIDFFIRGVQLVGLPKSVGEIYGLLFISSHPLSLDDLVTRLRISKGSASQGVKLLRGLGAVKSRYLPGDRRDYFTAETELKALVSGFVSGELTPHLESGSDLLDQIEKESAKDISEESSFRRERILKLKRWMKKASSLFKTVDKFFG